MKTIFLRSPKPVLLSVISASLLFGCGSGGTARNNSVGQLNSVQTGPTWTTVDLQASLITAVCSGIGVKQPGCKNNEKYVNSNAQFGNVNVLNNVVSNDLGVTQVSAYTITYNTPGVTDIHGSSELEDVSGVIEVPNIPSKDIKGVVLYFHPTVLSKFEVPSNYTDSNDAKTIASIFASQGYIVVMPDYIGQGHNAAVMHPYVTYPEVNAASGINMLTATRTFLKSKYNISNNLNLYISSYSEGGAYALWSSKLLQGDMSSVLSDNAFTLKRTVGISGAYDILNAVIPFSFDNTTNYPEASNKYNTSPGGVDKTGKINPMRAALARAYSSFTKPQLFSYALTAFMHYTGRLEFASELEADKSIMNPDFVDRKSCAKLSSDSSHVLFTECSNIKGKKYGLNEIFNDPNLTNSKELSSNAMATDIVFDAIGSGHYFLNQDVEKDLSITKLIAKLSDVENPTMIEEFNNSVKTIAHGTIQTDPKFIIFLEKKNIHDWQTSSPISLVYLRYDSTVTNVNSIHACNNITAKSSPNLVHCVQVDNTQLQAPIFPLTPLLSIITGYMDHGDAEAVLNLVALNEIKNTN